jgi:hypothetical protein
MSMREERNPCWNIDLNGMLIELEYSLTSE